MNRVLLLEDKLIDLLSKGVCKTYKQIFSELSFPQNGWTRGMFERAMVNIRKYEGYNVISNQQGNGNPAYYEILVLKEVIHS